MSEQQGRQGLAKWLALELAPTILGSKPSTVLTIKDNKYFPFLELWRQHGRKVLDNSILQQFTLKETAAMMIVLFYRSDTLAKCITDSQHRKFLQQQGYPVHAGVDQCLAVLKQRFADSCPHEMGILLGIPLGDVQGFMGLSCQQLTCRGCWHIYGNPQCSLLLMEQFKEDRSLVYRLLNQGSAPSEILCGGV